MVIPRQAANAQATVEGMSLHAKVLTGVSVAVILGLVAVAIFFAVPRAGTPTVRSATAAPTAMPDSDLSAAYVAGGNLYDETAAAFELPLPSGYSWPAGADRKVTLEAGSQYVWHDWIAANAAAAHDGDTAAAAALDAADIPFTGPIASDVAGLIQNDNYSTLLLMYPLPAGMKS